MLLSEVDAPIQEPECVLLRLDRQLSEDHLKHDKTKTVNVEFLCVSFFEVLLALTEFRHVVAGGDVGLRCFVCGWLRLLLRRVDVLHADVTDFYLSVVGVDVDGLAGELAVHHVVLVEEGDSRQDFLGPVFYDFQSDTIEF